MITDTIDFAKAYARMKWESFPCRPHDKTPLVKWADVATADEQMLSGWWDINPDANIGIACGKRSGIVVLDVDADHNGYESLALLIAEYGKLPDTPVSKTGSGGEHIFFKHPGITIAPERPAPSAPPPGRPPGPPVPPSQAPPAPPPPQAPAESSTLGTLAIRIQPRETTVVIDGERRPGSQWDEVLLVQLPEGTHRVEVEKKGYETFAGEFSVRRGETTRIEVSLVRKQ